MCKRGDIYYVNFGNNPNSFKQSGLRPAVIVSNNKANCNSPLVTVIPLTTKVWKKKHLPTHVLIHDKLYTGLNQESMALAEQVETLDKSLLDNRIGEISDPLVMEQITIALQIQIGVFAEYN